MLVKHICQEFGRRAFIMKEIEKYNMARKAIESRFNGLPHASASLIKSLITFATPSTGVVSGLTWPDVAKLIEIDRKSGRQGAGLPGKNTVREYVNTIIQQCGNDFKLTTVGQKLQFQFPNLPAIYAQFFGAEKNHHINYPIDLRTEDHTDCHIPQPHINTGLNGNFHGCQHIEVHTDQHMDSLIDHHTVDTPTVISEHFLSEQIEDPVEVHTDCHTDCHTPQTLINARSNDGFCEQSYTEDHTDHPRFTHVYNNNYKNYNNNNNFNAVVQKLFITDDFIPNQATISEALSYGYSNVTDLDEIKNFINHNKAIGSQWADFNPVYLRWLERGFERRQKQLQHNSVNVGRKENEQRPAHTSSSGKTAMAELIARNKQIIAEYEQQKSNSLAPSSHCQLVAKIS